MGIIIDRYSPSYINKLSQPAQEKKATPRLREERKFDEVLISASGREKDEKRITEGLVREVMDKVHGQVPQERMEALKKAVADGTYQVDADAVARKMLLTEGDSADE